MATGVLQLADQAAEKLDFPTPMDFIRKTHVRAGEPCDTIFDKPGCTLSSCGLDECLERGAEAIKWAQIWKGWGTPAAIRGSKRVGLGMSAFAHDSAIGNMSSSAILKVNLDGTADFLIAVGEIGNGVVTTQTQVVSEASGIPFDNIRVINADTMYVPVDPSGIVCSSSAHIRALAAESAGKNVKKQLVEMAARYLEVQPEVLEIKNGNIFWPGNPSKSITIKQLMQQIHSGKALPVSGVGIGACPRFPQKAYNYGAHFALVEVDTATGQIRVLDYVAAHDVGKAINPAVCEAQIQGGVVMGISSTLAEELVFDEKGRILNLGMTDYKIYTAADSPIIRPLIIESGDPLGAYGAKGFAESPMVGTPGCLANALYNAIGIRFKEFPITPERVLAALKTRLS
jgi:xanthine dehydrogenase molybdenum-binding subunit